MEHLSILFYGVSFLYGVSIFFNLEPYGGHLLNVLIKFLYLHQLYKLPRNYYNRTPKTGVFGQAFVSFFLFFIAFRKIF